MAMILARNKLSFGLRLLSACKGVPKSYHVATSLSATPKLEVKEAHLSDYGKYYEPTMLENTIASFADSRLVKGLEEFLIGVQDFTGLPWWANIVTCTFILRTVITAPLFLWQMKNVVKYQKIVPALKMLEEKLNKEGDEEARKRNWNERTRDVHIVNSYMKHRIKLMKEHKIPGAFRRHLLPWVQLPVWLTMSIALRDMTLSLPLARQYSQAQLAMYSMLSSGGTLWFADLCAPDTSLILPMITGLCNLAIIEIHIGNGKVYAVGGMTLLYFARFISISLVPIGAYLPSAVVLYWASSSLFGLIQALVLRSLKFRRIVGIPILSHDSKTPYKDIISRFKPSFKR